MQIIFLGCSYTVAFMVIKSKCHQMYVLCCFVIHVSAVCDDVLMMERRSSAYFSVTGAADQILFVDIIIKGGCTISL
jgi:hypothetical protein